MNCLTYKKAKIAALCCLAILSGCVSAPVIRPPKEELPSGRYHQVEKGQTLWRISRIYNVELEELVRLNNLPDAARIETGQIIMLPAYSLPQVVSAAAGDDFIWPLPGSISSDFAETSFNMVNKGIDIKPVSGNSAVMASRSGRVVFYAPALRGFGRTMIIDHGDGLMTVYARTSEVLVKVGDLIQKGAIIARLSQGKSGKDKYLHFEIRKGYIPQNPNFYLP